MIKFDVQVGLRLQNSLNLSFFKFVKDCGYYGQKHIETRGAIVCINNKITKMYYNQIIKYINSPKIDINKQFDIIKLNNKRHMAHVLIFG